MSKTPEQIPSWTYTDYHFPNPLSDGTPATYDAYELTLVGEFEDEHGVLFVEPVFEKDLAPKRTYWTIFGHTMYDGVTALVDVETEQEGIGVLNKMGVIK